MSNSIKLAKELYKIWRGCGLQLLIQYLGCIFHNTEHILRTKSLGIVDQNIAKKRAFVNIYCFGYNFRFLSESLPSIREIFLKNCYGFIPKRYGVVIDLGANRGVFSVLAGKFSEKVYSIECNPKEFFEKFQSNAKLNHINNLVFISKFASNTDNEESITLNSLCNIYNIESIDFIKIDYRGRRRVALQR